MGKTNKTSLTNRGGASCGVGGGGGHLKRGFFRRAAVRQPPVHVFGYPKEKFRFGFLSRRWLFVFYFLFDIFDIFLFLDRKYMFCEF